MSAMGVQGSLAEMVRQADRDRYLAALYAPAEKRAPLLALFAFNIEIARIRDLTHEPMAGELRLQWWRDAVTGGESTQTAGHPVADALNGVIDAYALPRTAFANMIEARRFDLYNDPMPARNDLEGYCGETAGSLIQLSSLVLDAATAANHGAAAGHAGCAHAIAGLLSMLPVHCGRGQCFIPADILAAAGATSEDLAGGGPGEAGIRAVTAMIALGREHLAAFERHAHALPASLRPAFLPAAPLRAWYRAHERAGAGIFERHVKPSPISMSMSVFRKAIFGWR